VRPSQQPVGRGTLVSRRYGTVPVQLVHADREAPFEANARQ
jgi:hypothetical protein